MSYCDGDNPGETAGRAISLVVWLLLGLLGPLALLLGGWRP